MIFSKVKAMGLAGLIVTGIIFALGKFGIAVDETTAAALVTVISFILGYFKLEKVGRYPIKK